MTDQPGAAPVSVIDQPDSGPLSSIVTCSCCDCRNATAVVPQVMAMTAVTDQGSENEHRHWGSPPPVHAVRVDRRRLQRMGGGAL